MTEYRVNEIGTLQRQHLPTLLMVCGAIKDGLVSKSTVLRIPWGTEAKGYMNSLEGSRRLTLMNGFGDMDQSIDRWGSDRTIIAK